MSLLWPFTKIAKMFLFGWTKWSQAPKMEKEADCHASINNLFKRHLLLNESMDFEIILQEWSLSDPLPKLLKWSCWTEQNSHQS